MNFNDKKSLQGQKCILYKTPEESIRLQYKNGCLYKKDRKIDDFDRFLDYRIDKGIKYMSLCDEKVFENTPNIYFNKKGIYLGEVCEKFNYKKCKDFDCVVFFKESFYMVLKEKKLQKEKKPKDLNRLLISKFLENLKDIPQEDFINNFIKEARLEELSLFEESVEYLNLEKIDDLALQFELENNSKLRSFVCASLNAYRSKCCFLSDETKNKFEIWKLKL